MTGDRRRKCVKSGGMDVSEQGVGAHCCELLGSAQWGLVRVEIDHAERRVGAWASWRIGESSLSPHCREIRPGYDRLPQRTSLPRTADSAALFLAFTRA